MSEDQTGRNPGSSQKNFIVKGAIAMAIILASTLAGAVWPAFTMNGAPTYYQSLDASFFGFLVGVVLVLTALLAHTK